jgi:hypothetical protein
MASSLFKLLYTPGNFEKFLAMFNMYYSSRGKDREHAYETLIKKYTDTSDYLSLFEDTEYISLAYNALLEFGIDERHTRLISYPEFESSILNEKSRFSALNSYRLEQLDKKLLGNILSELLALFQKLKVVASSSSVVGTSRILHFLLPNLVMPLDEGRVLRFYYGLPPDVPLSFNEQFDKFKEVFENYRGLAQHLNLSLSNWDGNWWNMSVPKRIDNAIAGYWIGFKDGIFIPNLSSTPKPST